MTTRRGEPRGGEEVESGERPSTIDPRIRARRVEVRRSEGRRRLRVVVVLGALLAVALLGLGLFFTPLLDVDRFTVAGQFRTDPADIVAAGGIEQGAPLLTADLDAAADRIEALPWVAEATARRRWPGTVRYRVVERVPAAAVAADDDTWVAVDGEGQVLALLDGEPADLPVVEGATVAPDVGAAVAEDARGAFAVAAVIPEGARPLVDAIVIDADGGVTVRLVAGGIVTFGALEDLPAKGVALASVLDAIDPCIATLDLSVASAPVLTRTPGCG
ncbi:MAG: FtsQ-type POTRA domain-containing protein [Acidimicrobiales bacterium]|nr:FtsQ-type POTRA domain-containing protein [Acidimicrobiales bacterium]